MPDSLIIFPLVIYMFSAILCLFAWKHMHIQKWIYMAGTISALVISSLILWRITSLKLWAVQIGGWEAPFGITVVVDIFSALMVLITAILGFVNFLYSYDTKNIGTERKQAGYYPTLLFMLMGITGAFITGDLFNMYVWFEVMLIASFVLITLGSRKKQLEGGIKYVTINFIASSFLLLAVGTLYGITGSTNMADLAIRVQNPDIAGLAEVASMLLLTSFGIKAALFPLFFWLPSSYHTPPMAISGIMAGLLTKVGVYSMIRTYTLLFPLEGTRTQPILMILAGLTMIFGVLGAIAHYDFRKILSFHIISQIGYMVMGLAINTPLAIAGAIFYMVHHILVKTNLFLISGITAKHQETFRLKKMGGIYDHLPFIAMLFAVAAFSLSGIPPLSGFWGKYALARAGLESRDYLLVGISLLTGLLTLFSMSKIWRLAFLPALPARLKKQTPIHQWRFIKENAAMISASFILIVCTLFISFNARPLVNLSDQAARQLINREQYIQTVLGHEIPQ